MNQRPTAVRCPDCGETVARTQQHFCEGCRECADGKAGRMASSHLGSSHCNSGSVMAGGTRVHCHCDEACF